MPSTIAAAIAAAAAAVACCATTTTQAGPYRCVDIVFHKNTAHTREQLIVMTGGWWPIGTHVCPAGWRRSAVATEVIIMYDYTDWCLVTGATSDVVIFIFIVFQ